MKWYAANTGNHQGLIIDEESGRSIAVSYEKEDANLIAAAPELLKACELALEVHPTKNSQEDYVSAIKEILQPAINKAKEEN